MHDTRRMKNLTHAPRRSYDRPMAPAWWERADWSLRSALFGAVDATSDRTGTASLAIEMKALDVPELDLTWAAWGRLPRIRNVLEPVKARSVRYLAIDWLRGPLAIDAPGALAQLTAWGDALTRALEMVIGRVTELGRLTTPFAVVDVTGEIAIGFVSAAWSPYRMPPEVATTWPRADARSFVHVIGQVLRGELIPDPRVADTAFGQVLSRSVDSEPARRFQTLADLRRALLDAGGRRPVTRRLASARWTHVERGLGFLAAGHPDRAVHEFEAANAGGPDPEIQACLAHAQALDAASDSPATVAARVAAAREHEAAGQFVEALRLYGGRQIEASGSWERDVALARCSLRLGRHAHAIARATRALGIEPTCREARVLRFEARFARGPAGEALADADAWVAAAPDDGAAQCARGKCLLQLNRLADARAAFDRACTIAPQLLEAMLLRREADRLLGGIRAEVGSALPMTLGLPAELAALREALAAGRDDALVVLRGAAAAGDTLAAQLLQTLRTEPEQGRE